MIRLLSRYVVRTFTGTFLMLVLGLPLLFIVADVRRASASITCSSATRRISNRRLL